MYHLHVYDKCSLSTFFTWCRSCTLINVIWSSEVISQDKLMSLVVNMPTGTPVYKPIIQLQLRTLLHEYVRSFIHMFDRLLSPSHIHTIHSYNQFVSLCIFRQKVSDFVLLLQSSRQYHTRTQSKQTHSTQTTVQPIYVGHSYQIMYLRFKVKVN